MAVQSPFQAALYILATGQEVLPLGGFTGFAPESTLARIQQLTRGGQLRFFLLGGGHAGPAGRNSSTELCKITRWVQGSCRVVPARDYGHAATATGRPAPGLNGGPVTLYECGASK